MRASFAAKQETKVQKIPWEPGNEWWAIGCLESSIGPTARVLCAVTNIAGTDIPAGDLTQWDSARTMLVLAFKM